MTEKDIIKFLLKLDEMGCEWKLVKSREDQGMFGRWTIPLRYETTISTPWRVVNISLEQEERLARYQYGITEYKFIAFKLQVCEKESTLETYLQYRGFLENYFQDLGRPDSKKDKPKKQLEILLEELS